MAVILIVHIFGIKIGKFFIYTIICLIKGRTLDARRAPLNEREVQEG